MIEIIYLDIDGTLRDEQEGIPDSAVLAIGQCKTYGIKIIICTGRNFGSIQDDVKALPTDGIISGGGCYIQFQGKELLKKTFSMILLKQVLSIAANWQLSLAIETKQKIYMDYNASMFYQADFQHKISRTNKQSQEIILMQNKIAYQDNFNDLWNETQEVHKICMFGKKEAIDKTKRRLEQETEVIQKKEWNRQWYLELLPKGCNKGSAVIWLNRKLGISKNQSMSFGDSENDIAMMKATGIAVAVGNSNSIIKSYASSICEPLMEDGIYKELVRRTIIKPVNIERRIVNE